MPLNISSISFSVMGDYSQPVVSGSKKPGPEDMICSSAVGKIPNPNLEIPRSFERDRLHKFKYQMYE
jgi:hypothetical protein